MSTCPLHGSVYKVLFRVPVSSRPVPDILNLKSAEALDFRVHTVMCVCLCMFLKREAIAFRRLTEVLLVLDFFLMAGETQKCQNHIVVLLSLKFLKGLCLRTVTGGENKIGALGCSLRWFLLL